jgi:hypothetical protein
MKKLIASLAVALPAVALAQPITDFDSLTFRLGNIANALIVFLMGIAILYMVFNIVRFIVKSNDPAARSEIGQSIMWSIVGLFVIVSIWGLVGILRGTFRFSNNTIPRDIPSVPIPLRTQ